MNHDDAATPATDRTAATRALWHDGAYEDLGALFEPISSDVVGHRDLARWARLARPTATGVELPAVYGLATVVVH